MIAATAIVLAILHAFLGFLSLSAMEPKSLACGFALFCLLTSAFLIVFAMEVG